MNAIGGTTHSSGNVMMEVIMMVTIMILIILILIERMVNKKSLILVRL